MHVLREQLVSKLIDVGNLCHRADGKASEVRIYYERLCVRVTNNTYTRRASFEAVKRGFKLCSEIRTLQVVDRAHKTLFFTIHRHAATTCTEMRVVVGSVEQICNTAFFGNGSEDASHKNCYMLYLKIEI